MTDFPEFATFRDVCFHFGFDHRLLRQKALCEDGRWIFRHNPNPEDGPKTEAEAIRLLWLGVVLTAVQDYACSRDWESMPAKTNRQRARRNQKQAIFRDARRYLFSDRMDSL